MEAVNSMKELRREFAKVKSGCAGDTIFMAKAMMFLAELRFAGSKQPKRKPSAYNKFFAAGVSAGKSVQQIGKEWRERKV